MKVGMPETPTFHKHNTTINEETIHSAIPGRFGVAISTGLEDMLESRRIRNPQPFFLNHEFRRALKD
jgi:hypothetical protein